jgi:ankyrin repeat protein
MTTDPYFSPRQALLRGAGVSAWALTGLFITALAFAGPAANQALMNAVRSGNLSAVRQALQMRADPNAAEADGTTAVFLAVQRNRLDILETLTSAGAAVNARNQYGITPLAWALTNGSAAVARQLLKAGANPRVPVPEMGTALIAAAHTGDAALVKDLLNAGLKVDEPEPKTGQTPLMWAAAEGHESAVKALVAAGADTHVRSNRGETALFFAVRKGNIGVTGALLAAGADVNERAQPDAPGRGGGMTPAGLGDSMLVVAILNAHFGLADFLLNHGADPNSVSARWTPLHSLSRVRDYEEVQYPPPPVVPGDLDSLELAKRLIARGANPNARGQTITVRRQGGDQNYKDLIGATPFFLASKSGDVPYMRLLLAAGADPAIPSNDHTTPLMIAAGVGCVPGQWIEPERDVLSAVKLLTEEEHADVNAVNDRNETALHGAVCRSADSVIQYLADKGAKLDVRDADGLTPLEKAMDHIYLPITINGPVLNRFPAQAHTIALLKKLTEEQSAARPAAQSARR